MKQSFNTAFSKCYLTFYNEEDECLNDFLFDSKTNCLAVEESADLANEEKYSRYKMMFDDNCVYQAQVLAAPDALENAQELKEYPLEKLGLKNYELKIFEELGYKNLAEVDLRILEEHLTGKLLKEELLAKITDLKELLGV